MSKIKLTQEDSEKLAIVIAMIRPIVHLIDLDYAKVANEALFNQAYRQETLSVLNPSHNPIKNDLLRTQSKALGYLVEYIECLKKCDELKTKISESDSQFQDIQKMFL